MISTIPSTTRPTAPPTSLLPSPACATMTCDIPVLDERGAVSADRESLATWPGADTSVDDSQRLLTTVDVCAASFFPANSLAKPGRGIRSGRLHVGQVTRPCPAKQLVEWHTGQA